MDHSSGNADAGIQIESSEEMVDSMVCGLGVASPEFMGNSIVPVGVDLSTDARSGLEHRNPAEAASGQQPGHRYSTDPGAYHDDFPFDPAVFPVFQDGDWIPVLKRLPLDQGQYPFTK